MIADDIHDIREGMRKLAQAKVQAEAEAAKRAEADAKPADLPTPKPLFSDSAPPFRGFFVSEDGDIVPLGGAAPEHTWADWIDTQDGNLSAMGARVIESGIIESGFIQNLQVWDIIPSELAEQRASRLDPGYSKPAVQAVNRTSNSYSFWGFAGEDPDGQ